MKHGVKKVFAVALLSACTTTALAEGPFAVEVLVGKADQTTEAENGREYSGDDASLGLRAAYRLNPYVELELAYADFGEYEETYNPVASTLVTDEFSASALSIGGKAIWPVNEVFSLHARAGIARWTLDLESRASSRAETFSDDDSGFDLYYGVGAGAALGEHWRASLEYTVLRFDAQLGIAAVDQEVENLALAVGYRF